MGGHICWLWVSKSLATISWIIRSDICVISFRTLKVKHFETYFGEVLAMYDRIGEYFDDRSTDDQSKNDGVPKTSIALLHRHPPDPAELHDVRRFGSLMPESAAIPRKRPLTITQPVHRNGFDGLGPEQPNSMRKRQKTQQMYDSDGLIIHQDEPILSREEVVGVSRSSQTWGTQGSVHQVIDSQRSPTLDSMSCRNQTFQNIFPCQTFLYATNFVIRL